MLLSKFSGGLLVLALLAAPFSPTADRAAARTDHQGDHAHAFNCPEICTFGDGCIYEADHIQLHRCSSGHSW